ncbi:hypothetical protein CAPTEDRAFT_226621 [Capitella teleta]|uniref:CH-like domain-containing protein n=1 Tax=Capitella teleta TaxID=283909 RepID=R7UWY8_CAPTE|nr:hypothetical protein CAPTEDRAFT_226621 [Capitella teleta]|eukprot:ELU07921.1 hypothetical protein CAPTEDRAFT_226621 [Capitella teleta]
MAAEIVKFQIPKIVDMHNYNPTSSVEVMVAELIRYFIPRGVELHNYSPGSSTRVKEHNWFHLNKKVLRRLDFEVDPNVIRNIVHCRPWAIENFLVLLREKMDAYLMLRDTSRFAHGDANEAPEVDQQQSRAGNQGHPIPGARHSPQNDRRTNRARAVPQKQFLSPRNKAGQELVPKSLLLQKQEELMAKEETIQILAAKIGGLEKLISLKDIRIDDLTARIGEIENFRPPAKGMRKGHSHPRLSDAGTRGGGGAGVRGGGFFQR